jgi:serine/threonine protein kinase/tetratricopeptide (TPR) repeat protein
VSRDDQECSRQPCAYNHATVHLSRGSRIGRYEIVGHLGTGGMGVVYTAKDDVLDRHVAIKLLPVEFVRDPDRLQRFEQEARVTGRLNHPHIVSIFDAVIDGEQPYLVTELVEGETLGTQLSKGMLRLDAVLTLARQLAQALAAAHAHGVVHRDLKPDNILITPEGSAKVLDFGLARIVTPRPEDDDTRPAATVPGVVLGTMGYMAPEQVDGRAADHRADIFSLGVILHEALTGRQPFRRESVVDTLHAILHDEAPELPAHLPRHLRKVIARCLQKRPDARFQSARDLEFALEQVGGSDETIPTTATPSPVLTRPRLLAAVGVALLVAVGTWTIFRARVPAQSGRAEPIRSIAVLPLVDLSSGKDQEYLADSLTEALITDLSQISALRVIARTSVMRYKGSTRPLQEIARELSVTGIVEGTVQRVDDRLRVSANLVHAATEQRLWGEQYDREFRDLLPLQSELAGTIADRIAVQLTPHERARLTEGAARVATPASHELFLRGKYFWNKRDPASLQLALEAFTKATEADPQSAQAWAGLADTYFYLGYAFGRMPPRDAMPKAIAAARRALAIDPDLAEAHAALGVVQLFYDWDRTSAEASLRRALQLNPGYVFARRGMAALLLTGRQHREAIEQSQRAVQLDPVSLAENFFLALCYLNADELNAAEQVCGKTLELEPGYAGCLTLIGDVHERRGDPDKAVDAYLESAKRQGLKPAAVSDRLQAYRSGGIKAFRDAELQDMVRTWDGWHFMAFLIASKQAQAGHRDAAYAWLRRVRDARSAGIMLANSERNFAAYRSDPTFQELLGPAFVGEWGR